MTNIITPDGDGKNDVLRFNNQYELEGSEIWIYNRWGNEIYHTENYRNNWSGEDYPGRVYYYVIKYEGETYKSAFTIIK